MKRRDFLGSVGKSTAAVIVVRSEFWRIARAAETAFSGPKPNIIVILVDDLGYADLGIQDSTDIPTPNIDSIGKNGVRFTQGYVSCPLCAPTRAGLMTGRYAQRFGFEHNPGSQNQAEQDFGLPLTETTLAERLKRLGYATGIVGKWHLGFKPELQPTKRGFDEFFGFLGGAHPYLPGKGQAPILRGTNPVEEKEYLTDAFGREATAFIDRHKKDSFFLYLPFNAVHAPMQTTEKYLSRFPNIKDETRRTHAAMLSALDDMVGKVLAKLREERLEEKTLIILLSDNGGPTQQTTSSNAPLRGFKAQVLEGGIRIPFMIQWKGRLRAGKIDDRPIISLDIHPTAIAAAGEAVDPSWKLDGVNLLPYLMDAKGGVPHETLYWRMEPQWAIRHGNLKLLWSGANQDALYDLAHDPGESKNLASEHPEDVKKLKALYDAWNDQMQEPKWQRSGGRPPARAQLLNPNANLTPAQIRRQFAALDTNKDGRLTAAEWPRPRAFRLMDINKDGVVTLEEALQFFRRRKR